MLLLQDAEQIRLAAGARVVGAEHPRRGAFRARLQDRALALLVEVLHELPAVVREVAERHQQPGLDVVVVVAQRPRHPGQRRVLPVPGLRGLIGCERPHAGVGVPAVAEGFVEAADAVVGRREEEEIARRPVVPRPDRVDAGHPETAHFLDVVPADHLPFVHEQRIDPGVVGAGEDGVVVEIGRRLVQVVEDRGVPVDHGVQHVLGQLERHAHGVAVVVVGHVLAPVDQRRRGFTRVLLRPVVDVDHAVAAVHFDDRREQGDDVVADVPDVRAFVDRQPVGQLHQRRRRARLGRVDRAGRVVDRDRVGNQARRLLVVHVERARVGELREPGLVLVELCHDRIRRDRHRDHLPPFLGRADREHLDAGRGRLRQQPHVLVDLFRVRQVALGPGDVSEDGLGRRHGLRRGQVIN